MRCVLVQESWVDWPDPVYDKVGNILLSRNPRRGHQDGSRGIRDRFQGELGAGTRGRESCGWHTVSDSRGRVRSPVGRPGICPGGRRKSREQERALGIFFRYGHRPARSQGARRRGMIAGFAAQERSRRVIGIDASAKTDETLDQVTRIARQTASLIENRRDLRSDEIHPSTLATTPGTYGISRPADRRSHRARCAGWRGDDHRPCV